MGDLLTLTPKIAQGVPRLVRAVAARVRPDHATIMRCAWRNDHGSRPAIFANVACAPSRRRAWTINVPAVRAWAAQVFGGHFNFASDWVTANGVARFQADTEAHGRAQAQLVIWPSGLVEFTCPIPSTALEGGGVEVAITDITGPIIALAEEVRRGIYGRVLAGKREALARLDWFVGCSGSLADEAGSVPLRRLAFPNDVVCGRPEGREMTPVGQGTSTRSLMNLKQGTSAERIALTAIEDLLQSTGHYDYGEALDQLRATLQPEA